MKKGLFSREVLRYPRLDTVLMVEDFIKNNDSEFRKRKLWESLPKSMMYQTFCTIIDYLLYSHKISIDSERKIGWIYYPELVKKYLNKPGLLWKPNTRKKSLDN